MLTEPNDIEVNSDIAKSSISSCTELVVYVGEDVISELTSKQISKIGSTPGLSKDVIYGSSTELGE